MTNRPTTIALLLALVVLGATGCGILDPQGNLTLRDVMKGEITS